MRRPKNFKTTLAGVLAALVVAANGTSEIVAFGQVRPENIAEIVSSVIIAAGFYLAKDAQ